jgi:hypothetical protein
VTPAAYELIFLERLLNFRAAVHHERTVTDDGFVKWFAAHYKEFGTVSVVHHGHATVGELQALIGPLAFDSAFENPVTHRTDNHVSTPC